ncbi:MAG: hypothetical protein ACYDDF_13475 [Thermoplasmatota archaeon]
MTTPPQPWRLSAVQQRLKAAGRAGGRIPTRVTRTAVLAIAAFSLTAGCIGSGDNLRGAQSGPFPTFQVTISGSTVTLQAPAVAGYAFSWDFGDFSGLAQGASVRHAYNFTNGETSIVMSATDRSGNVVRVGRHVMLGTGLVAWPIAQYTASRLVVPPGAIIQVDASGSSDPAGNALSEAWVISVAPGSSSSSTMMGSMAGMDMGGMAGMMQMSGLPDSGVIGPGATGTLHFGSAGLYQVHCHPHPFMLGNVRVVGGAPTLAEMQITQDSFQPATVEVAPGGTVRIQNLDSTAHSAEASAYLPEGTTVLTGLRGAIPFPKAGTFNLTLALSDGKGTLSTVTQRVTVTSSAPSPLDAWNFSGTLGNPPAVDPAPENEPFQINGPGQVYVNSTAQTAPPAVGNAIFTLISANGTVLASGSAIVAALPAGTYALRVSAADAGPTGHGFVANVPWTSTVRAWLDLSSTTGGA